MSEKKLKRGMKPKSTIKVKDLNTAGAGPKGSTKIPGLSKYSDITLKRG